MKKALPNFAILIGFPLVLMGFIITGLIILNIVHSTFFLNFLAYTSSVAGLLMGIVGIAQNTALSQDNNTIGQFLQKRK